MFRRIGTILSCLALFLVAGGHWAVLQSVAWAGMIENYSRADGFTVAVQKTFSGDYPCAMCRKIDEQKNGEQQTPVAKVDKKNDTLLSQHTATALVPPPPTFLLPLPADEIRQSLKFAPPQPVPRRA